MNLNDCRYRSLRTQGYTGHVNDMLRRWLQDNGATSGNINDAWREMLSAQGYTGHVNDSWRAMLDSLAPPEIGRHINDLERWFWCQNSGEISAALFSVLLQSSLIPEKAKGDYTPTFTRASEATFTDFEGVVRTVNSGEPRFSGARRVENLLSFSEDFSNAVWSVELGCTKVGAATVDGVDCMEFSFDGAQNQSGFFQSSVASSGVTYTSRVKARAVSGTADVNIRVGARANVGPSITLTETWQDISDSIASNGTAAGLSADTVNVGNIYVAYMQIEEVTGQSNQSPSSYVSTDVLSAPYHGAGIDGVKYFTTLNGNTVASNVVTEATGIPITDAGVSVVTDIEAQDALTNATATYPDSTSVTITNVAGGNAYSRLTPTLITGEQYRVTGELYSPSTNSLPNIGRFSAFGAVATVSSDDTWTSFEITGTASAGIPNLDLQSASSGAFGNAGDESRLRNLSVKPLHYNADASGPFGYLSESAATNLMTYSEAFDNAAWLTGGLNSAINAEDAVAPDGTVTADQLIDDNAGGTGNIAVARAVTVSASTEYTFSVFAKADQINFIALQGIAFTTPANGGVWFDLSSGTVGTENAGYSGAIEGVGNGWYRCSITFTTDAVDTSGQVRYYACDTDGSASGVDRDGTSSIHIWGAQLEAGSFPTSYIKTEAATVTRSADVLTYDDVGNIEDAAGTAKCEASSTGEISGSYGPYILEHGSGGRLLYMWPLVTTTLVKTYDGTTVADSVTGDSMEGNPTLLASAWGENLTAYFGGIAGTPAAYDGTIGSGDIAVGCRGTGEFQLNGTIRLLEIHNKEGKV